MNDQTSIIPPNAVFVTAAVTLTMGVVSRTYTTTLTVQTHRGYEIKEAIKLAWEATKEQADAATAVPPGQ